MRYDKIKKENDSKDSPETLTRTIDNLGQHPAEVSSKK